MAIRIRTFATSLAAALLAGALPLRAQLDPRLQTSSTDFLNLFQQSVNLVMKPEVVTVFDFSGSMGAVMYHPTYGSSSTLNTDLDDSQSAAGMRFIRTSPAAGRYDVEVRLTSGQTLTGGKLVRPDGSLLDYANNGDTAINTNYVNSSPLLAGESNVVGFKPASDVRNWIRSASHARFTANGRTFDLPICWTILADPSVVRNVAAGEYRQMYASSYPLRMTIADPASSPSAEIEMDSAYRVISGTSTTASVTQFSSITTGTVGTVTVATDVTIKGAANSSNNFIGWKSGYVNWLFTGTHSVPQATSAAGKAFKNGIPGRTRVQALKEAAMMTWAKYHNKVFWAYRFLKYDAIDSFSSETESSSAPSNNSRSNISVGNPTTTPIAGATQRAWVLLNNTASQPNNSVNGLRRLAYYVAHGSTPLNSALLNTLAQLNDPNSVFNDVETGADKPVDCRNTYLLLFTDGIPNTDAGTPTNTNTPYVGSEPAPKPATAGSALTGNSFFNANKTRIDPAAGYFNIINLAGLAAHGGNTNKGGWTPPAYPATTQSFPAGAGAPLNSAWIPFWIKGRGTGSEAIVFSKPHAITTMTVGVSLAGAITNAAAPKRRLFLAAAVGDPTRTEWDVATLTEFTLVDPSDPTKGKTANSCYYFDATDPDKLTKSLDSAFSELSLASNINVNANPNLPYIGATFGKQVYFGKFQPPTTGGTIWDGDLLAFSTRESASGIEILDAGGNPTSVLNETTAVWSAKQYLKSPPAYPAPPAHPHWTLRKIFTRIPWDGNIAIPEPGFTRFTDLDTLPSPDNGAYTKIKPYTVPAAATDADRKAVIQFIMGGNTTGTLVSGRPVDNRSTIMGDIINSSPSAIEYTWPVPFQASLPPSLTSATGNRFRMIFVGTNQGLLHAFGEVSQVTTVPDADGIMQEVIQAKVGELWSFIPTDFLKNLSYITQTANPHRFLVDGTPNIYHLDLPPADGSTANGTVDAGERAMVIIGLRKGGRSYYAIDISNPTAPVLKWSLVPDEAALYGFPASRIETGGPSAATVTAIVKRMGFSTATPSIGRIKFNGILRDAVFFSGGLSLPEVEANFLESGTPMKLGRSVLALDVNTGKVLAAVDMTTVSASIAPIPAGLVPFEFILNSGMAQRAYFLDGGGGLWAWGSRKTLSTAPFVDYRVDSSDLAEWTTTGMAGGAPGIRKVAQDSSGNNAKYSTLPAPFRVGAFPGKPKTNQASPAAVGIAMVSGDRNNPLDEMYTAANRPTGHRLTVVFDRQDSKAWSLDTTGIVDTNLKNFTTQNSATAAEISPGNASYYLAPSSGNPFFGYYVNFLPAASGSFVNKGITEPMVVAGSLFYTFFNPTSSDACVGGSGTSFSRKICDVINPIVFDSRTGLGCTSGGVVEYVGVATAYLAYGTRGVLQAGTRAINPVPATGSVTTPSLDRITGRYQERFPKPRVWRTVR